MKITSRVASLGAIVASLVSTNVALAGSPDEWAGPYVGLHVGYGQDKSVTLKDAAGIPSNSFDMTGSIGGGQIGYNWAVGPMVMGVEGTASATNIDGSKQCASFPSQVCGANLGQLYTVKGQLGIPLGNFLFYGSAGVASGKIEARFEDSGVTTSDSVYRNGWLVGLGSALAINLNWNAILDLQYVDFGNNIYDFMGSPVSVKNQFVTLHFGVNYKF